MWKPIGMLNIGNTYYLNSLLQCISPINYFTTFLTANTDSPLIKHLHEFTENKKESKDVTDIRTLLVMTEPPFFLYTDQSAVHGEVQGIFHTYHQ